MPDDLSIKFPSSLHNTPRTALPPTFFTVGVVKPKVTIQGQTYPVKKVTVTVELLVSGTPVKTLAKGKSKNLRPDPVDPATYLVWAVRLVVNPNDIPGPTTVRVTVSVTVKGNAPSDFPPIVRDLYLAPPHEIAPTFSWPDQDNYVIQGDERDCFVCFGDSDIPITALTLGQTGGYFEWSDVDNSWWGQFSPGTSPGTGTPYTLQSSNADGDTPLSVTVAAQ